MTTTSSSAGRSAISRQELFISYAVEDGSFARWLAAKLALCGYRVWWDQAQLHGGAAFPTEIDDAIKNRAFRVLAVMSLASSHKANPERERSLALALARERKEDFLVPLNLGLTPAELPFQVANLTFVPFMQSWADGLAALLETLRGAGAPCFPDEAEAMVRSHLVQPTFIVEEPDPVWLNLFPITNLPPGISRYEWTREVPDEAIASWVHHREDERAFWSFEAPPDLAGLPKPQRDQYAVSSYSRAKSVPMSHVCKSILRQYVEKRCISRGLVAVSDRGHFYFSARHPNASRLTFILPSGRGTWLQPVGTRRVWQGGRPEQVRHHLAILPQVEYSRFGSPMLVIRPTVYFTAEDGSLVDTQRNVRRAKAIRRTWYNDKWLARVAALGRFLGDGADSWKLSEALPTTVASVPMALSAPSRLDEQARAAALKLIAEGEVEVEGADDSDVQMDDDDDEADHE